MTSSSSTSSLRQRVTRAAVLFLGCSSLTLVDATYTPAFLQSGADFAGSSFPASVTYSKETHSITIVGSTFGRYFDNNYHNNGDTTVSHIPRVNSTCFLATVQLPVESVGTGGATWTGRQVLPMLNDAATTTQACSSAVYSSRHSKLIVAGHSVLDQQSTAATGSPAAGVLDSLYDGTRLTQATQYGMLLDWQVATPGDSLPAFTLRGGRVLQSAAVTYPIAVTTDPTEDWVYVVSQESNSGTRNTDDDTDNTSTSTTTTTMTTDVFSISDEADPTRWFQYGDNYGMSIARYKVSSSSNSNAALHSDVVQETLIEAGWSRKIATTNAAASVHVAGLAKMGQYVIVAGSTDGTGAEFGGDDVVIQSGTMSGFVTKLDVTAGLSVDSHRVQSMTGQDDWIGGMCHSRLDLDHVYVVGSTEGTFTGSPLSDTSGSGNDNIASFLMKINVATLEEVWVVQIGALEPTTVAIGNESEPTEVRGVSCTVSPDGNAVWFGGVVLNDGIVEGTGLTTSFGGDDIFVVKLESESGERHFTRQFGSRYDDGMAMRGGLVVDAHGNAVVVGNTYGSMYRQRSSAEQEDEAWISDVIVTTIESDNGNTALLATHPDYQPAHVPTPNTSTSSGTSGTDTSGGKDVVLPPSIPNTESVGTTTNTVGSDHQGSLEPETSGSGGTTMVFVYLALMFAGMFAIGVFVSKRRGKFNPDVSTKRGNVTKFLNEFDVDDIDLKHSATGGWHCSYSNDLAKGVNRRASRLSAFPTSLRRSNNVPTDASDMGGDPLLMAPLTNSSVLQDSLFMDDDSDHTGGDGLLSGDRNDRFSDTRSSQRQGYDGLIDAYNSTWNGGRGAEHQNMDDGPPVAWGKDIL